MNWKHLILVTLVPAFALSFLLIWPFQPSKMAEKPGFSRHAARVGTSDGDLDTTFGLNGILPELSISGFEFVSDSELQPDGKIVVVGESDNEPVISRYNANGTRDSTFGTDGTVAIDILDNWAQTSEGYGISYQMALQADGKILVTGNFTSQTAPIRRIFVTIYRFNSDGTPDVGFGTNGVVQVPFGQSQNGSDLQSTINDISVQADGKIVVGGSGSAGANDAPFGIFRFNIDGTLDTDFDGDGKVILDPDDFVSSGNFVGPELTAITIQPDGKIIAVGGGSPEDLTDQARGAFIVYRLNTDGSPDTSFNSNGLAFHTFSNDFSASPLAVALQPDGKIVTAGYTFVSGGGEPPKRSAVVRFNSDGTLDTSFDSDGALVSDLGNFNELREVLIQTDGKIVGIGSKNLLTGTEDIAVVRYNADGSLDTGFGSAGIASIDFFGFRDQAHTGFILPDGSILAAGLTTTLNQGRNFALVKLNSGGTLEPGFGSGGRVDSFVDTNVVRFVEIAVQPNGRILAGASAGGVFVLAGFNSDGSLDTTFGSNGTLTAAFDDLLGTESDFGVIEPLNRSVFRINAVEIQSDGKIVAMGGTGGSFSTLHLVFARFNMDGSPDTSFDSDGKLMTFENLGFFSSSAEGLKDGVIQFDSKIVASFTRRLGTDDPLGTKYIRRYNADGTRDFGYEYSSGATRIGNLAVQADGKLLIPLASAGGSSLVRLNHNGRPDLCFGFAGSAALPFGMYPAILPDERILVAGSLENSSTSYDIGVVKLNADGSIDNSYGNGGISRTDIRMFDSPLSINVLTNGKTVIGGSTGASIGDSGTDSFLSRLDQNGNPDNLFGTGGSAIHDFGNGSFDQIRDTEIQSDGKILGAGEVVSRHFGDSSSFSPAPATAPERSDISVTVSDSPDPTLPGSTITYSATVENIGQNEATNIHLVEAFRQFDEGGNPVPQTFNIQSASIPGGSCVINVSKVLCSLGNLIPSESKTVTIELVPASPGRLQNVVQAHSCDQEDSNYSDNSVMEATNVAEITVGFFRPADSFLFQGAVEGDSGTFILNFPVRLAAPSSETITVDFATQDRSAVAPDDYVANTGRLTFFPGQLIKTIPVVIKGDTVEEASSEDFKVILSNPVNASLPSLLESDAFGYIYDDDRSRMSISKSAPATAITSSNLTYTIRFNSGTDDQTNVVISDPLPNGATFVSASDSGFFSGGNVMFNIGDRPGGSGVGSVSFTVRVPDQPNETLVNSGFMIDADGSTAREGQLVNTLTVACPGAAFDFDGDCKSDISVFRPDLNDEDNNFWYVLQSSDGAYADIEWGVGTDTIAPADYDGDGKTDYAVWRESDTNLYVLNSSDGTVRVEDFGLAGDKLIMGDWDGDGKADPAVWREGPQGTFYYRGSNNNAGNNIAFLDWGTAGDKPVWGDFDGDGRNDPGVFRPSDQKWYIYQSSNQQVTYETFGLAGDIPVAADYDGDGITDIAVLRDGLWFIKQSSDGQIRHEVFGLSGDLPVAADYDGDGKADVAVFRNGIWYLLQSQDGFRAVEFGLGTDTIIPGAYNPN